MEPAHEPASSGEFLTSRESFRFTADDAALALALPCTTQSREQVSDLGVL